MSIGSWGTTPDAETTLLFRNRMLILMAVVMLTPITTCWLTWHYEKAGFPVKPRDFTLLFGAAVMALIAWNRPKFCWQALLPVFYMLARIIDAAVLQRYSVVSLGNHDFYVMIMLSNFLVTLLFVLLPSTERGTQTVCWVASAIIIGCALADLYEWAGFGKYTRIPGRMSGFLEDPNHSPIIICLLLGVLFTINPNFWWNMALVGISAPAIAVTLSRSGMAVFAVMVLPYVLVHFRERFRGLLVIALLSVPLAGVGFTFLSQSSRNGVVANQDVGSRLEAIYSLDFEKIKSPERAKDLQDGWEAVGNAIMFGHGTGAGSNEWQPHNQFVTVWLDMGIFAVLFYGGLIFLLAFLSAKQRFHGFFCVIPLVLFIPCSQILIDTPVYWFTLAVLCQVLFPRRIALRLIPPARQQPMPASGTATLTTH